MNLGPYLLGPNDTPENGIYIGDAKELALEIPNDSVDLIFADPIYENIDDYLWLAEMAKRVLRDSSACLAWTSTPLMPDCINAMSKHLDWAWCLYWNRVADKMISPGRPGITVVTPCLWFEKGRSKTKRKMADLGRSRPVHGASSSHKWSKPPDVVGKWINAFVDSGGIVLDPFTGSGTVPIICYILGVKYLAFEIDPSIGRQARENVDKTELPLFSKSLHLF